MPNPHGTRLSRDVVYTDAHTTYAAAITKVNSEDVDLIVFPPASVGEPPMPIPNVPFAATLTPGCWSFA